MAQRLWRLDLWRWARRGSAVADSRGTEHSQDSPLDSSMMTYRKAFLTRCQRHDASGSMIHRRALWGPHQSRSAPASVLDRRAPAWLRRVSNATRNTGTHGQRESPAAMRRSSASSRPTTQHDWQRWRSPRHSGDLESRPPPARSRQRSRRRPAVAATLAPLLRGLRAQPASHRGDR